MNKIVLVAKHEFMSTLKRRSALFTIFGLPLIMLLLVAGINWLNRTQGGDNSSLLAQIVSDGDENLPAGLVDSTGQLDTISPPADSMFVPFPSLDAAKAAYDAGEISSYYHIPADYLERGQISQYAEDQSVGSNEGQVLYGVLLID